MSTTSDGHGSGSDSIPTHDSQVAPSTDDGENPGPQAEPHEHPTSSEDDAAENPGPQTTPHAHPTSSEHDAAENPGPQTKPHDGDWRNPQGNPGPSKR